MASGTGNAAIPAAQRGASVTASDLTPELLEAGQARPEAAGLDLTWTPADAENLPFDDESFDVVMSSIGVMFAPHHQAAADELVRVCRPGGKIGLLSWTPEGMIGSLFATMKPFAAPPPAGSLVAAAVGQRGARPGPVRRAGELRDPRARPPRDHAFDHARDYGEHFKAYYGPTIAARANAVKNGLEGDFDAALDAFCDKWDLGHARRRPLREGVPGRGRDQGLRVSYSRRRRRAGQRPGRRR